MVIRMVDHMVIRMAAMVMTMAMVPPTPEQCISAAAAEAGTGITMAMEAIMGAMDMDMEVNGPRRALMAEGTEAVAAVVIGEVFANGTARDGSLALLQSR
jgi:hypothetical protein